MGLRLAALNIDAGDPLGLARFWAEALGWDVHEIAGDPTGDEVDLVPTDGTRFEIVCFRVPERKTAKNTVHLDLSTTSLGDRDDLVRRLVELGARRIDVGQSAEEDHVVLADPEGNELCILAPGNTFLAGCERLGAINCEGTKEVGYFWSEALGWPLVWDQDGETAIRAPDLTGPLVTWSGPPIPAKVAKNRLHLDLAPTVGGDQGAEVERLVGLGATRIDIGQGDVSWVVMADPGGNEFCVLTPR